MYYEAQVAYQAFDKKHCGEKKKRNSFFLNNDNDINIGKLLPYPVI